RGARRAGARLRPMADLRALPAVRRLPPLGRAGRRRTPPDLDRRPRPRGLGPAPELNDRRERPAQPTTEDVALQSSARTPSFLSEGAVPQSSARTMTRSSAASVSGAVLSGFSTTP